jgi:hypothetical protein
MKEDVIDGHAARMGEMRNACNILVEKLEGKRPPVRNGRIWKDKSKMYL